MNLTVPSQTETEHDTDLPISPFAWGVGQRLAVVAVLIATLWLAVAVALDWLGVPG
ncbi:MAG: hypothetical protein HQL88_00185 [Magnetococcales bacterium]|nr:hypothetical protein [Magnetococcales bacterium]